MLSNIVSSGVCPWHQSKGLKLISLMLLILVDFICYMMYAIFISLFKNILLMYQRLSAIAFWYRNYLHNLYLNRFPDYNNRAISVLHTAFCARLVGTCVTVCWMWCYHFHCRWCNIKALPGANRLIKHLHGHGVPMALASNSPRASIESKISCHQGRF